MLVVLIIAMWTSITFLVFLIPYNTGLVQESGILPKACLTSQFQCVSDGHCISDTWHCDGKDDCDDLSDEKNCEPEKRCTENDFQCANGQCIPSSSKCDDRDDCGDNSDENDCPTKPTTCSLREFRCDDDTCIDKILLCDQIKNCADGSDERNCTQPVKRECPGNDFQCANGRCILSAWKCDHRDDCGDNSDENDCPVSTTCEKGQFLCGGGECINSLWRCDGEKDCKDSSDEQDCHATVCHEVTQLRCDHGQCIPSSWTCDGTPDCLDGTDERNCSTKPKACSSEEFQCGDEACIDKKLMCDQRNDCSDGSDERNCRNSKTRCEDKHMCKEGLCIYAHEVCDGHVDCADGGDEANCKTPQCLKEEYFCTNNSRCISKRWICDGDDDCGDAADENPLNCTIRKQTDLSPLKAQCEEFFCEFSGECIPWSKVCDGNYDCSDRKDEGHLCSRSCTGNNGGCSQKCAKTPDGSKCSCFNGYRLMEDELTCEDINECLIPGSCSHFCNNTEGGFECTCAEGYFLSHDHKECKADGGPAKLVYLLPDQIRGIDLSTHTQRVYVEDKTADMRGMDYDASEEIFFWTDWKDGTINSYTPSTNKTAVLLTSRIRPNFLRWDWIARNLYYTDDEGSIMACHETGKFCTTLIKNAENVLNSFDVAPRKGLMFWSVWSVNLRKSSGIIERADMDGSHRMAIVTEGISWPSAVTVDHLMNLIYWTDAKLNVLECSDFYGLHRRTIVAENIYNPLSMAVFEDYVFWSDWASDVLIRCGKFDGKNCTHLYSGNVKAEVLMVVHKAKQPKGNNSCRSNTCSHMCLIAPLNNYKCVCPTDFTLSNDGRTCLFDEIFPILLVNDESRIYNVDPETGVALTELPIAHFDFIGSLAFDWNSKTLYVADMKVPAIYAINMTSLTRRGVIKNGLVTPEDIAFDWISGNLYWVDSSKGTVEVVSIATSQTATLIVNLTKPSAIALVPQIGRMFISTIGEDSFVAMYNMDGTNQVILNAMTNSVVALAAHPSKSLIYMADPQAGRISFMDYQNPKRQPSLVKSGLGNVTSVAVCDKYIFWTDSDNHVLRVRNNNTWMYRIIPLPSLRNDFSPKKVLYTAMPATSRSFAVPCSENNGGCSHLCLTAQQGRSCVCPSGMVLSKDEVTCKTKRKGATGSFKLSETGQKRRRQKRGSKKAKILKKESSIPAKKPKTTVKRTAKPKVKAGNKPTAKKPAGKKASRPKTPRKTKAKVKTTKPKIPKIKDEYYLNGKERSLEGHELLN